MPFYCYKCDICKETFTIRHGMFFEQEDCTLCNSRGHLFKIPDILPEIGERKRHLGDVVKSFIKSSREDLEEQKREIKNEEKK